MAQGVRSELKGRWAAVVVVLGVVVGLGVYELVGSGEPSVTRCPAPTVAPSGLVAPAGRAPIRGSLRVTEQGFTQLGRGGNVISVGGTVENTSDHVAYRVPITFAVTSLEGVDVLAPEYEDEFTLRIPIILPGQVIPVGNWGFVRHDDFGRGRRVARLRITLGQAQWLPFDARFTQVSTRYKGFERSNADPEGGTVTYAVNSRYCRPLPAHGIAVVFRDGHGVIMGGSFESGGPLRACAPGVHTTFIGVGRGVPVGIDAGRTEVYPYCDFDRSPTA